MKFKEFKRNLKSYEICWSYDGFSKELKKVVMDLGVMRDFQKELKEL